jgi:hypothetical protein
MSTSSISIRFPWIPTRWAIESLMGFSNGEWTIRTGYR